jgi:multidrug efflux system membrane fusion protein
MKFFLQLRYLTRLAICLQFILGSVPATFAGGPGNAIVEVAEAQEIDLFPVIWMPGTIISRYDSRIASEVDGRVQEIYEVGDYASEGEVIARIDNEIIALGLAAAKAEIAPLESRLSYLKRETNRLESLTKENLTAKNQVDEMRTRRDETAGELEVTRVRLELAKTKLEKTAIKAPFSGFVSERYKTKGEWAAEGDDLLRLVNTEQVEIQVRVPVKNINYIKTGDELTATVNDQDISVTINNIVPVGDSRSRLYEIRLLLDEGNWMTGQAVKVAIPDSHPRTVLAVPSDSLVIRQDQIKVFRIKEQVAEQITVKTGITNNGMVEINGNIKAGDKIVIRGNERLRHGQNVTVIEG